MLDLGVSLGVSRRVSLIAMHSCKVSMEHATSGDMTHLVEMLDVLQLLNMPGQVNELPRANDS